MAEQQSVIDVQRIEIENLDSKIRDENEKFEEQSEELALLTQTLRKTEESVVKKNDEIDRFSVENMELKNKINELQNLLDKK